MVSKYRFSGERERESEREGEREECERETEREKDREELNSSKCINPIIHIR